MMQAVAFAGQFKLLLRAIDDQCVEVLLHGAQLLAYCGLSDTIEFCCFGKAFALDEVAEDFQVF